MTTVIFLLPAQMNIFFLHPNPRRCARWHCDKHVVKMIIESCQLLYTCHWALTTDAEPLYLHCAPNRGYKATHPNHPCGIWLRQSLDNYRWLVALAKELLREYYFRYGTSKVHACEKHIEWLAMVEPEGLVSKGLTRPAQAMPEQFRHSNSIVAYRAFYSISKDKERGFVKYTKRHRPHFLD
jgi:hypothetical protein